LESRFGGAYSRGWADFAKIFSTEDQRFVREMTLKINKMRSE
jgi:hypothetical protein